MVMVMMMMVTHQSTQDPGAHPGEQIPLLKNFAAT